MKRIFALILVISLFNSITTLQGANKYNVPCNVSLFDGSLDTLKTLVGVLEKTGKNDGEIIRKIQITCGLPVGAAYCQATQYHCFEKSRLFLGLPKSANPIPKNGLAQSSFNHAKKVGVKTAYTATIGDLIVWKKGETIYGHIGRIVGIGEMGWVMVIEGNTSNGGVQGIFVKKRNIGHPLSRSLQIKGLVGFNLHDYAK